MNQTIDFQGLVLPDGDTHKNNVSAVFNTVSSGYDDPVLRFFPSCADRIVSLLKPKRGWKVLDVATGTGALAGALAQVIRPGRVIAIDLSEGMLEQAEQNIKKMALDNVDFYQMDAEAPEFRSDYFDAVTCSFGLFFIPDMLKALRQWRMVAKKGGVVLFSSFTENSFRPLLDVFTEDLEKYGVDASEKMVAGARLKDANVCRALMEEAGYTGIEQNVVQVGYHLRNAEEWWNAIWYTAMRGLVGQLKTELQEEFRQHHLKRVEALRTQDGVWMDVEVRLTSGKAA